MSSVDDARLDPRATRFVVVPKRSGGERRLTLLGPEDAEVYARVVARLSAMIERTLGAEVTANRIAPGSRARLRPWQRERRSFERRRLRLVRSSAVVVAADVRECYPSIRPEVVEDSLVHLGAQRSDARPVRAILERLEAVGVEGLPIGPDPSAILANAVLARADDSIRAGAASHLRWVDDVWAGARDDRHAAEILDRLRECLGRMGLSLNEGKTSILARGEALALLRGAVEEPYR